MGGLEVANPIYREIIVRELAASTRAALPAIAPRTPPCQAPTCLRIFGSEQHLKLVREQLVFRHAGSTSK
jgi:hypothetical protein